MLAVTSWSPDGCGGPGGHGDREQRKDGGICVAPCLWRKQKLSQNPLQQAVSHGHLSYKEVWEIMG